MIEPAERVEQAAAFIERALRREDPRVYARIWSDADALTHALAILVGPVRAREAANERFRQDSVIELNEDEGQ